MSYQIQYDPEFWKERRQAFGRRSTNLKISKLGLVLCVAALCFGLRYRETIAEFLIPGDPAITTAAADHLRLNLIEGEPVKDALLEFCTEILEHEQIR